MHVDTTKLKYKTFQANVICREAGFPLGAKQVIQEDRWQRPFNRGHGQIVMDRLNCTGEEKSILDCSFDTDRDCGNEEWVGVICRESNEVRDCDPGTVSLPLSMSEQ